MGLTESRVELPMWIAGVVVALFAGSLAYGIVVMQSALTPIIVWLGILGAGLSAFVVYLLYRLVLAVETIADER